MINYRVRFFFKLIWITRTLIESWIQDLLGPLCEFEYPEFVNLSLAYEFDLNPWVSMSGAAATNKARQPVPCPPTLIWCCATVFDLWPLPPCIFGFVDAVFPFACCCQYVEIANSFPYFYISLHSFLDVFQIK